MRKWRRGCGGIKARRRQLCLRGALRRTWEGGRDAPFFLVFRKRQSLAPNPLRRRRRKMKSGLAAPFPLLHLTPNLTIFPSFSPFSTVDRRNLAREALYPSFPSSSVLGASGRTDGQRLLPPLPSAILSPRAARAALRRSLRDTDSFFPAAARELSPPPSVRPSPLLRSSCGEGGKSPSSEGRKKRDSSRLDIVVVVVVVRGGDELGCD